MLSVSEKYSKAILADSRDMPYRVTLAGAIVLDQTRVPRMTLDESASGSSEIALGTSNAATLKLTLKDADTINYNGMLVEPESGLVLPDGTIEWLPLGKFWVTNFSTSDDFTTVNLECADGMYHLTGRYKSELTYPTTLKAVVNEILAKTGVNFAGFDSLPNIVLRVNPGEMTFREAIGYAAGCCGCNARFNREGNLEFFWYKDTGLVIERKAQYLNGMTKLYDKPLRVDFEVSGAQEMYTVTCISDGNGGITATPGQNVLEGETVVLSINPFHGYELATISAVTDSGVEVSLYKNAEGGYTFVQPDSNVTVTVSFRTGLNGPFKLTTRAYDGGDIAYAISEHSAGDSYFNAGDTVMIFVTPESGYEIDKLITTPANIAFTEAGTSEDGGTVYEFTMPQSDVTINAYFKETGTYYTIERIVDYGGLSVTPGYIVIENLTTGGSSYSAGDIIAVRFARTQGHVFDRYEANVSMAQIDSDDFQFTMPANNVSITAHFKYEEDNSKADKYSWLALPADNTPPTSKPYWAVFYKHNTSVPVSQRFYLVWFDSWTATGYDSDGYGERLYSIKFDGYYYCGSKNKGHYPHEWDATTWSGNGASGSTLKWDSVIGFQWAGNPAYSGDYCLIASNTHLYYNSTLLFQMCPNAIQVPTESYLVDGMDVRERGAFGYYKCPDTFSTPAPAANWMILDSHESLLMDVDEDGQYSGYSAGWSGLYVVWFDDIAVKNVGAVFDNNDEELYVATVTNGHYVALCKDSGTWGTLRDIGENQVIGLRNPMISESYIYSAFGTYYFNGLLVSSCNISSSGTLLKYKNDCKICDCEAAPTPSKFLLRRVLSDAIEIDANDLTVTTEGDAILLSSRMIIAHTDGETLSLTVSTAPAEEAVTITYTNPMIYEKMVDSISSVVSGVTYTPAKIKHRGNPAFQVGDMFLTPDKNGVYHNVLIAQQTMTFGGGMNSEFSCPGRTEKEKSFSSSGPITAQIKQEVQQSNLDLERRIATNNALVFNSLYRTISATESRIDAVVEWQTANSATIASVQTMATENRAAINTQAILVNGTTKALASLEQKVTAQGASIGLVVENNKVKGSILVEAINGQSTAKISADKLDIEGKTLNIKVDHTNIDGKITADQLNVENLSALGANIGPFSITDNGLEYWVSGSNSQNGTTIRSDGIYVGHETLTGFQYTAIQDGLLWIANVETGGSYKKKIMQVTGQGNIVSVYVDTKNKTITVE